MFQNKFRIVSKYRLDIIWKSCPKEFRNVGHSLTSAISTPTGKPTHFSSRLASAGLLMVLVAGFGFALFSVALEQVTSSALDSIFGSCFCSKVVQSAGHPVPWNWELNAIPEPRSLSVLHVRLLIAWTPQRFKKLNDFRFFCGLFHTKIQNRK